MGYRKVYRTVDEQTTKKMVKMLQRHGIMAYGKSEGAGEILQITTGIPYQHITHLTCPYKPPKTR